MPQPTPQVLESANRFRAQLLARERRAASGMARYYGRIWGQLQGDIRYVQSEVERKRAADEEITQGQIWRMQRLKAIQAQADRELARFAEFADDTITAGQRESIIAGERNARDLMLAAFPADAGVDVSFAAMPREAVESLVGFLADGSPLKKLLVKGVGDAAQGFADMMVTGLAAGWNPRKLARALRSEFGMGLTRALRIARTEQLRAYRTASLKAYQESDTVVGWERMAAADDRTCMACVMLDGKRYGVDEPMDDHPQGRCVLHGTVVAMNGVPLAVQSIGLGMKVRTSGGVCQVVTGRASRLYDGYVIEVKQGNHSVIVTPGHEIRALRGGLPVWLPAWELREEDTLMGMFGPLKGNVSLQRRRYDGLVYDLEVDNAHHYIAGGIMVHNCAMLPITKSYAEMGIDAPEPDFSREKGEDWFLRQPAGVQEDMMGAGMYAAWKDGAFELSNISKVTHSDVWGDSWTPKALKELT